MSLQVISELPQLPPRPEDSHKGTFGRVLVVGGSRGMSGAVCLAGLGALRGGAGLVTVDRTAARRDGSVIGYAATTLASLSAALANVVTKHALVEMTVWNAMALRTGLLGLLLLLPMVLPGVPARARSLARRRRAMGTVLITEGLLAPLGTWVSILAVGLGPVSLVSALTASRPLFILALTVALSTPALNLLNEPLNRDTLILKLVSTALVGGGVATLAFF